MIFFSLRPLDSRAKPRLRLTLLAIRTKTLQPIIFSMVDLKSRL
jgi:hypothetical protein